MVWWFDGLMVLWFYGFMVKLKVFISLIPCGLDVNECFPDQISAEYRHLAHNCNVDANCSNTKGSFYCTCHTGYSGDGVTCIGKLNHGVCTFIG